MKLIKREYQDILFGKGFGRERVYSGSLLPDNTQFIDREIIEPESVDPVDWFDCAAREVHGEHLKSLHNFYINQKPIGDTLDDLVDCCDVIPEDCWFTVENNAFELFDYNDFASVVVIDFETVFCPSVAKRLPIMAVVLSDNKLYYYRPTYEVLPYSLDSCPATFPFPSGRVVIGHFVSYDRKYLSSEYDINNTPNYFVDTASLATICHGISNQQELIFLKCVSDRKKGLSNTFGGWFPNATRLALGGELGLYKFLFNEELSKDVRKDIIKEKWDNWTNNWTDYAVYCQKDVLATNRVFCKLYPKARKIMPNVVSWAGMLQISNWFMVLDENWFSYFENTEKEYYKIKARLQQVLCNLATNCVKDYATLGEVAPQLACLEWREMRVQDAIKYAWFRDFKKHEFNIGGRVAPVMLQLHWNGLPINWVKKGKSGTWVTSQGTPLPHPDTLDANLSTPLTYKYIPFVEQGILTSKVLSKEELLDFYEGVSNLVSWTSLRERVHEAYVVKNSQRNLQTIPEGFLPIGTQSRRVTDNLWVVATNPDTAKIGSEFNQYLAAPKGYKMVGADWDSEESWLATVLADGSRNTIGCCEWCESVLVGDKAIKTGVHDLTAKILDIPRNYAKNINFAVQYGAGKQQIKDMLIRALQPENTTLTPAELANVCEHKAVNFLEKLKGSGGFANHVFTMLKRVGYENGYKTLLLDCNQPDSLAIRNCTIASSATYVQTLFVTTRQNWIIQSSGVDVMHCLLVGIEYLCRKRNVKARLAIVRHDEARYYVPDKDADLFAEIMQTVHARVVALAYKKQGFNTCPESVLWFSGIEVDDRLRKSPEYLCITPTNPNGFPVVGRTAL